MLILLLVNSILWYNIFVSIVVFQVFKLFCSNFAFESLKNVE